MRSTKAVHVSARVFNDAALVAASISEVITETDGLMTLLFGDKPAPNHPPVTTESERSGLIEWLIKSFPYHVMNASPELLRFGLNEAQIQLLHYRLKVIPERMGHFVNHLPLGAIPSGIPLSDVVVLLPAMTGQRLSWLLGDSGGYIHLAVCWAMLFEDSHE